MNLKNVFTLNAVMSGLFGLGFVLIPGQLYDLYGITMDNYLQYTSQLYGATLVGLAVLSWMIRDAAPSKTKTAVVTGFFIGEGLGFVMALIGQFRDTAVSMGWINVAIFLVLALAFGYFFLIKPETS